MGPQSIKANSSLINFNENEVQGDFNGMEPFTVAERLSGGIASCVMSLVFFCQTRKYLPVQINHWWEQGKGGVVDRGYQGCVGCVSERRAPSLS